MRCKDGAMCLETGAMGGWGRPAIWSIGWEKYGFKCAAEELAFGEPP